MNQLKKEQVINNKVYDQNLKDDTVRKLEWDELQKNVVNGWWHDDRHENR